MFLYNRLLHLGRLCGGSKFVVLTNVTHGLISSRRFEAHSLNTGEAMLRFTGRLIFDCVWFSGTSVGSFVMLMLVVELLSSLYEFSINCRLSSDGEESNNGMLTSASLDLLESDKFLELLELNIIGNKVPRWHYFEVVI